MNIPPQYPVSNSSEGLPLDEAVKRIVQSPFAKHFSTLDSSAGLLVHDSRGVICDIDPRLGDTLATPREKLIRFAMGGLDVDFPQPFIAKLWETR